MAGWTKVEADSTEVSCFRRPSEDSSVDTFKAELFYEKAPNAVSRYIYENWGTLNRELQPEEFSAYEVLSTFNEDARLVYSSMKPKGPVDARDTVAFNAYLDLGDNVYAIVSTSVDSDRPVPADTVRAEMKIALHLFEPVAGNAERTHHQNVTLVEPKGLIPAAVINGFFGKRATFFDKLREHVNTKL
jgi:hypothetical protein